MSQVRDIPQQSHEEVFQGAVERRLPIVLSRKTDDGWVSCKSRFLAEGTDQGLIIESPGPSESGISVEFAPGDHVGISFRRGHKKCLCSTTVVGPSQFTMGDGTQVPALAIQKPTTIRQLQRRAYNRNLVPVGVQFDVEFWEGGLDGEENAGQDDWAVYTGTLIDISAGGFCLSVPADRDPRLGIGDTLGCRLTTRTDQTPITFDANFRHANIVNPSEIHLGFQIVGLETTAEGIQTLQRISQFSAGLHRVPAGQRGR